MTLSRRSFSFFSALTAAQAAAPLAFAQAPKLKIGVLTDMSGALSSVLGKGSVDGARMAIEDFGSTVAGMPVELVFADHQNKPDVGAAIARRWFDEEQVDMLLDLGNSAVAIACQTIAKDKNKIIIVTGASSSDITNKFCNSHSFHWGYDTYMQSAALAGNMTKGGDNSWFFLSADYAYGQALEADARKKVLEAGGKVLGGVKHPANTMDMSSFLLQAQSSGAKVIGLATTGEDMERIVKQGQEFGIWRKQKAASFGMQLYYIPGIGPANMQGMVHNSIYYWDRDDKTRDLAQRFLKRNGKPPAETHAVNYSAVTQYLKAVKAAGTKETGAVLKALHSMPVEDLVTRNGKVRADGRLIRPTHLVEVKSPGEIKGQWDLLKVVAEIPGDQAFRPPGESVCTLLKT
ncbi:ABC transporter substrate-binding protein [Variovorax ginsengisoli]|uniref:ABC transporter substrate-binding protein n=1 Tax=Variovorax ginsengisoli TaxID=363844 RepID=A0ABT8S9L6_9BURK|nr:ABC transporter substrate-binding protein [Variovorax ginsengisoli]MDN8616429.1 ABC transporter substrate-binding protein [Variovorax ginsengisoli]MDO1535599.1 ABC transporter substrate-binding protein [Variovorax ginsengisoli]